MKHVRIALLKITTAAFLIGILMLPSPYLFSQEEPAQTQALKSFRITPKRHAQFTWIGAVYNPTLNLYIVLFYEYKEDYPLKEQTLYSQMFSRKGKKVGPLNKLSTLRGAEEQAPFLDIALNEKENQIAIVWSQGGFDEINVIALTGDGRVLPNPNKKTIKPKTGIGSGLIPQIVWIPGKNQYAVGWSHMDPFDTSNPDMGFYLSILKPNLTLKLKPIQVKQHSIINDFTFVNTLIPLDDRIFWGASKDAKKKVRPMVWFTDYQGKVIKVPKSKRDGSIYPGPKIKGGGWVYADYNPYQDQYLLLWTVADDRRNSYRTYSDTYFRIMDSGGFFAFQKRKMPKNFRFHHTALTLFNPIANRFLVVYSEHKILSNPDPFVKFQGGRLWATYIDSNGQIGLPDEPDKDAFPLTDVFTTNNMSMNLLDIIHNPVHNEDIVFYMRTDYQNISDQSTDIWGIILK